MATNYIQNVELPLITQRCQQGQCKLVPVIVDFCHWTDLEFASLNALPYKDKPITHKDWTNENEAWMNVVEGIKRILETD